MSPAQRSLKHLRDQGYTVAITEKWNPYAKVRQDLFGMFDLLAFQQRPFSILGVQTTTGVHLNDRIKKVQENLHYGVWKAAGGLIVVHGWRKICAINGNGKKAKKKIWEVREVFL